MSFPLRALPLTKRTGGSTLQRERTRARQPYVVLKFFGRSEITALFMLEVFVESRIEKSKAERFTSRQSRLESSKWRERQYQSLHYCVLTWFYSQEKHLRNNSGWQREHRSFLTIFPPSCRRLNVKSQHTRLRQPLSEKGKDCKQLQCLLIFFGLFHGGHDAFEMILDLGILQRREINIWLMPKSENCLLLDRKLLREKLAARGISQICCFWKSNYIVDK